MALRRGARFIDANLARFVWARRLEREREMTAGAPVAPVMAEVSDATGFSSPAHFSAAFKTRYGVRPSELVVAADRPR